MNELLGAFYTQLTDLTNIRSVCFGACFFLFRLPIVRDGDDETSSYTPDYLFDDKIDEINNNFRLYFSLVFFSFSSSAFDSFGSVALCFRFVCVSIRSVENEFHV